MQLTSALAAAVCGATTATNIVELAVSVPDLSTLVTAVTAGKLVTTLESAGPFTVFAPTNEAFAALPNATLAHLLDPANIAELDSVLTYHVLPEAVQSKDLKPFQTVKTVQGASLQIVAAGGNVFVNNAQVTAADNEASNGVVHIINKVLDPPAPAPTPAPGNHLWFRGTTCSQYANKLCQCGEVDAAPRMPASLFEPENAAELQRYIDITIKFYVPSWNLDYSIGLEVGRCTEIDYTIGPNGQQGVNWANTALLKPICKEQCHCDVGVPFSPNGCKDQPDDPRAGKFCSLCGPKFNQPITVFTWLWDDSGKNDDDDPNYDGCPPSRPKDTAKCDKATNELPEYVPDHLRKHYLV